MFLAEKMANLLILRISHVSWGFIYIYIYYTLGILAHLLRMVIEPKQFAEEVIDNRILKGGMVVIPC